MPLQATSGAASYDGFGGGVAVVPNYIEDVFSTWLYTGNGSTQTITNGINLASNNGLIWIKSRNNSTFANSPNVLTDSVTGFSKYLISSQTSQQQNWATDAPVPKSYGFDLPINGMVPYTNYLTGSTYASWTFRKQPKFFDVVTYTGDGNSSRTVSHNLGSVPGCIIVKTVSGANDWVVSHRSLVDQIGYLNQTWEFGASAHLKNSLWTSTTFTPGNAAATNQNGVTYVAYLFAHDAGGFGLTGTDNVISCGSWTGNATVNLGFEPQWILFKKSSEGGGAWFMQDVMRGMPVSGDARQLVANTSQAEAAASVSIRPNATGFSIDPGTLGSGDVFIYIAIRRGPMKTPTTGTSVFSPNAVTGNALVTTNFPVDSAWIDDRGGGSTLVTDRLRGSSQTYYNNLSTTSTAAENTGTGAGLGFDNNTGYQMNAWGGTSQANINWNFRRAPGFFDVVCYTGTGSARTVNHNLGVVPELIITKMRSNTRDWGTGWSSLGWTMRGPAINSTEQAFTTSLWWNNTAPTSSVFTVGTSPTVNGSGDTYVAYLFASCPGVSKVGSYTGTGTTLQIDCGFTGGARFVLIKRTDSTGDWYCWDSSRGIVSGNDPYLLLNSTAAEVTNTDYIDTYSAGFEISSTAPAAINANGGTFVFLAVA
jgi:hypothetical protein